MAIERTLIIIKPDGVQRNLVGEIISRFERRGLKIAGMKLIQISKALAETHYEAHRGKGFFAPTVAYMSSQPTVIIALEGPNAIAIARQTIGATKPIEAAPGSIRADLGIDISRNLVHGSADASDAEREVKLYFKPEELITYSRAADVWLSE
jgi:nucleoside-diphosphate kinase